MGNASSSGKKPAKRATGQEPGIQAADEALEAELRSAQEAALRLAAGIDVLSQEIALEQRLAAIDDEAFGDVAGPGAGGGADDEDVDLDGLDPDELAELEGELQELEREVLGLELELEGDSGAGADSPVGLPSNAARKAGPAGDASRSSSIRARESTAAEAEGGAAPLQG